MAARPCLPSKGPGKGDAIGINGVRGSTSFLRPRQLHRPSFSKRPYAYVRLVARFFAALLAGLERLDRMGGAVVRRRSARPLSQLDGNAEASGRCEIRRGARREFAHPAVQRCVEPWLGDGEPAGGVSLHQLAGPSAIAVIMSDLAQRSGSLSAGCAQAWGQALI